MQKSMILKPFSLHQLAARRQKETLLRFGERCDWDVRSELNRFARMKWLDRKLFRVIPLRSYRLSKRVEENALVWRVEHDTPSLDNFLCEAYQVKLSISSEDHPKLEVQSKTDHYPVELLEIDSLRNALEQAGRDAPMSVLRSMGDALDP